MAEKKTVRDDIEKALTKKEQEHQQAQEWGRYALEKLALTGGGIYGGLITGAAGSKVLRKVMKKIRKYDAPESPMLPVAGIPVGGVAGSALADKRHYDRETARRK